MKIAFYNIMQGARYKGGHSNLINDAPQYPEFYELMGPLLDYKPDILGFAEVVLDDAQGSSAFLEKVSKALDLPYWYAVGDEKAWLVPEGSYYGVGLLSRWPIVDYKTKLFPNPRLKAIWADGKTYELHDKAYQIAGIDVGGRPITIINLHSHPFGHFKASLKDYPETYADIVETVQGSDMPVIVLGDLNSDIPYETVIPSALLKNAIPHDVSDYIDDKPSCQLDYILVPPTMEVLSSGVVGTTSDHPIVFAEVAI